MYDLYKDYFEGKMPYTVIYGANVANVYHADVLSHPNWIPCSDYKEYEKPLRDYVARRKRIIEEAGEGDRDTGFMKVVLVSDDWNRIRKTAQILVENVNLYENEFEETGDLWEAEENFIDNAIIEVDLGKDYGEDRKTGNPFVIKASACVNLAGAAQNMLTGGFLFRGLTPALLPDQCAAMSVLGHTNVFVGIPGALKDHPEIRRLLFERGYDIIRLPDMDPGYYKRIAEEMAEFGGVPFRDQKLLSRVISVIQKKSGPVISEEAFSRAFSMARLRMDPEETSFEEKHFCDMLDPDEKTTDCSLMQRIGLKPLKQAAEEFIAVEWERKRNSKAVLSSRHMIFEGNPGTGKTFGARLLANLLSEEGLSNGVFTVAERKDIIGKYVGHTAPLVSELFERSKGGVLFVDEAGFFLNENSGGFLEEAVKEFVRNMEVYRNVTVIFAFYPGEAKRFLKLDQGLNSRISSVIHFDDYTQDELAGIFKEMIRERGYAPGRGVAELVRQFISDCRKTKGKQYGNAREIRKLCDAAVKAIALRHRAEGDKCTGNTLRRADLTRAIEMLKSQVDSGGAASYGFGVGEAEPLLLVR